LSNISIMG